MSISATRTSPQDIEGPIVFKSRPKITDTTALTNLNDADIVTAGPVKTLNSTVSGLSDVIPDAPSANGTYVLTCTKSNSGATYTWESAG